MNDVKMLGTQWYMNYNIWEECEIIFYVGLNEKTNDTLCERLHFFKLV